MLDRKLDDADEWVRTWSAQDAGGAEATAALADRVAALTSSATGGDGAITVTVGSAGTVTGLKLADAVSGLSGAELSAAILDVMRAAQAGLTGQVETAVSETVGAGTETGQALLESYEQRFGAPEPAAPVMPAPPALTFTSRPTLPHQAPGGGFESGRDSRAR